MNDNGSNGSPPHLLQSGNSATITARGAVLYKARGGASSADELIASIDFGADKTSTAGTFTITWSASGIITLS